MQRFHIFLRGRDKRAIVAVAKCRRINAAGAGR
jgi:hypothetical protein